MMWCSLFFFKQKTAYEMRISDWSSDVCSSDLRAHSVPLAVEREQDSPPVGEDVPLGVTQHFLVERLDHEPAAQPFQVQAREILEIGRASCRERVCQYV